MVERYMLQNPVKRKRTPTYVPGKGRRDLIWACLAEISRGDIIASLYARMMIKTIAEIDQDIASEFENYMSRAGVHYDPYSRPRVRA